MQDMMMMARSEILYIYFTTYWYTCFRRSFKERFGTYIQLLLKSLEENLTTSDKGFGVHMLGVPPLLALSP